MRQYDPFNALWVLFCWDLLMTYSARLLWWLLCAAWHGYIWFVAHATLSLHWAWRVHWSRTLRRFSRCQFDAVYHGQEWERYMSAVTSTARENLRIDDAQYLLVRGSVFRPAPAYTRWSGERHFTYSACDQCHGIAHFDNYSYNYKEFVHLEGLTFHACCIDTVLLQFLYDRYRLLRALCCCEGLAGHIMRFIEHLCIGNSGAASRFKKRVVGDTIPTHIYVHTGYTRLRIK